MYVSVLFLLLFSGVFIIYFNFILYVNVYLYVCMNEFSVCVYIVYLCVRACVRA